MKRAIFWQLCGSIIIDVIFHVLQTFPRFVQHKLVKVVMMNYP